MHLLRTLLLAAALLVPASLRAQVGAPPAAWDEDGRRHAFGVLLEHRAELGLSPAQAERLGAIGRRLEAANRPLRERLAAERERFREERRRELERMTPRERRAELRRMRARGRPPLPPRMQPIAAEMAGNIRRAMREAHAVLTPAQRARVRELIREARTGEPRPRAPFRRRRAP